MMILLKGTKITLIICWTILQYVLVIYAVVTRNEMYREALFSRMHDNMYLGYQDVIIRHETAILRDCAHFCIRQSNCKSFNFNKGLKRCDLLAVDRMDVDYDKYVTEIGTWHYDTERKY